MQERIFSRVLPCPRVVSGVSRAVAADDADDLPALHPSTGFILSAVEVLRTGLEGDVAQGPQFIGTFQRLNVRTLKRCYQGVAQACTEPSRSGVVALLRAADAALNALAVRS